MATLAETIPVLSPLPPLEAGDCLDQPTFHQRYQAMPPAFRAELIGGIVFVPAPLSQGHGVYHALVMAWLGHYWIATPGTTAWDNATTILGEQSEPQPDAGLIIVPACGGQTGLSPDGYTIGPPECIVEVASSSASIDLHGKRQDYERAGVLEYIVVVIRQRAIRWFVRQGNTFQEMPTAADGIFRSKVFPGLWLHAEAMLQLDGAQVLQVLQQGLTTAEHRVFVEQLQARRSATP